MSCSGPNEDTTAARSEPADTTVPTPSPEETEQQAVVDGTLHVTGGEWRFDVPSTLDAGPIEIAFENESSIWGHELRLIRLAQVGRDPIGYARIRQGSARPEVSVAPAAEIHRLYVAQDHWGSGAGRALNDACIEEAGARGYEAV